MPEAPITPPVDEREYYEERVVEIVDNRRARALVASLLVVLFLMLLGMGWFVVRLNQPVSAPKSAELPEGIDWIRSIYAWGAGAETLMRAPVDTAIAPDGTIWVVTNTQVIAGFNPDGRPKNVITPPAGKGKGQVLTLEGIAVAENGDLYVCDFGRKEIIVFSPQGEYLRAFATAELPNEVHVRNGKVAVSTIGGVEIYDTSGKLLNKWGKRGSGEIGIDGAHGIHIGPTGTVFISDTSNTRIRAYTTTGRLLWTRGGDDQPKGSKESTATSATIDGVSQALQLPAGMTMDGAGRLLVVDPFEFQILALNTKNGQITARYGQFGPKDGEFAYPTGISYDAQRDILAVADTSNNRVQIVRVPGTGGNAGRRLLAGFFDRALWLCAIPLILLLVALIVYLRSRRSRRDADEVESGPAGQSPSTRDET